MLFCIGTTGTVRSEIVEDQNISSAVIFDSLLSESNVKSQIEDSMVKLKDLEDKCMTKDDAKNYMWKFCSLLIAVIFLVLQCYRYVCFVFIKNYRNVLLEMKRMHIQVIARCSLII